MPDFLLLPLAVVAILLASLWMLFERPTVRWLMGLGLFVVLFSAVVLPSVEGSLVRRVSAVALITAATFAYYGWLNLQARRGYFTFGLFRMLLRRRRS